MIIYKESTFFANNRFRKIDTFNSYGILRPKKKGKEIIVFNFLLSWSKLN